MRAPNEGPVVYRFLAALVSVLVWPFVRIDTHRLEIAHQQRTGIVVANHRSFFDVAAALVGFRRVGRYPSFISAANLFEMPVVGFFLRLIGAIPLGRENPAADLKVAGEVLDAGIPILMLPEGRLAGEPGDPTSLGEFKSGAARLAMECEVPVWFLVTVGTDEVWPKGAKLPRLNPFRRRHVVVLGGAEFVYLNGDRQVATDKLRSIVQDMLHEAVEIRDRSTPRR